jgi:hypothetical protein
LAISYYIIPNLKIKYKGKFYPPAYTLGEPTATLVQPEIPSPILPEPLPFTKTVDEPVAIGAT